NADAIGLSALLVSTSKQMPLCVKELYKRGLNFPVIVGGAAINRSYGRRILFVDEQTPESTPVPYEHGVFYARDAFEGLDIIDRIGIEEVAPCMDLNTLFRLHWGGKAHGPEFTRLVELEFRPRLKRMLLEARQQRYLQPKVIYGYFPCQSSGNELIVYEPQKMQEQQGQNGTLRELTRFRFPRQHERERLCLADYFAPVKSGKVDVVAFQIVTMGQSASEAVQR